jgi:hypothetical protein
MELMGPVPTDGLDLWMQLWVEGFVRFFSATLVVWLVAFGALVILGAWGTLTVRRRFWCRLAGREVEVEFGTRGLVPSIASVKQCSVFETGTAIACSRRCLDARFRRQWEPALPAPTRGRGAA